ncbi:IgGFc-binding protein-like [Saccostrea echinata]|uniref:IgGFc-binding protein-like n=1 Tax=Saccostrea echinata TaxID=191078 RepID=UPI002A80AF94|nr:IgGFc-binding protein-like [Saccostrea echinata]
MKDNTLVSIVLTADYDITILIQGRNYGRGDTFNIILNRYQTFQIGHNADLTGTTIHSSNPIAVFAGNRCNDVGYHGFCSMLMEMVPPTEELDNTFVVPPNIHRYQSHVRILSAVKTYFTYTTKQIKTSTVILKNKFVEFVLHSPEIGVIHSTEAVLVSSIALSSTKAKVYGDPFMITVPGINQYASKYTNFVPDGYNFSFATFIIRNESFRNLQINGTNISEHSCLFHSSVIVGIALYSVCTISVQSGLINVKTSDGSRFGFLVNGQRKHDGHGYAGNTMLTTSCGT